MLRGIRFNNENCFDASDDNNLVDTLTTNTIILCEDVGVKEFLAKEIQDICAGRHKEGGHDYYVEPSDELKCETGIFYLPTFELIIDEEQKILLTIEAPLLLTAKTPDDIWFAARTRDNRVSLYPMKIFEGYENKWNEGIYAVYKYVISGRYGPFRYGNLNDTPIGVDAKITEWFF